MASLEPPFQGENLIALGYSIVNRAPKPIPPQYSTSIQIIYVGLSSFIWKLLEKIPALRPSIGEINTVYFQSPVQ
jgi:NIMA (never in mitosis gene a)-related kinase